MKICQTCHSQYPNEISFCPKDGERLIDHLAEIGGDPLIGVTIDKKYLVEHKIAEGGMSSIYRAIHLQLDMQVAVKVMHQRFVSDDNAIRRFRREAQSAMQIRHTNAIAVMDFGVTESNLVYLIMEYLTGMTLREKISKTKLLSLDEINIIMQQVCAAVKVAHRRGLVHRDLKPENIFLQTDGNGYVVKVLDFGIAKLETLNSTQDALTQLGNMLGSPQYMSPEQFGEDKLTIRSDVYALGVILYELLTGELPFRAPSMTALAYKHMTEPPKSLLSIRPELPTLIDSLVMRALAKQPDMRPEDAGALAEDLADAFAGAGVESNKSKLPVEKDLSGLTQLDKTVTDSIGLLRLYARPEWPSIPVPNSLEHLSVNYNLEELFLPEFFGTLTADKVTGITWFASGGNIKGVVWKDGQVAFAISNDQSERLGERLVRQGRISRRQYNEAIKWQYEHPGANIIDSLSALHYMPPESVGPLLNAHIYSICYTLIDWEEGDYAFDATPYDIEPAVNLSIGELILESTRSLIDLGLIRSFLGDPDHTQISAQSWKEQDNVTLRPDEQKILQSLDRPKTITQIVSTSDLPEEQILRTLAALVSLKAVKRVECLQDMTPALDTPLPVESPVSSPLSDSDTTSPSKQVDIDDLLTLGPELPTIAPQEELPVATPPSQSETPPPQVAAPPPVIDMEAISLFFYELENISAQISRAGNDYYARLGVTSQTEFSEITEVYNQLKAKFAPESQQAIVSQMPSMGDQLNHIYRDILEAYEKISELNRQTPPTRRSTARFPTGEVSSVPKPGHPVSAQPVGVAVPAPPPKATPAPTAMPVTPVKPVAVPAAMPASVKTPAPTKAAAPIKPTVPDPVASLPVSDRDPNKLRNPDDWYLYGLELLDRGDSDRAIRAFQNAVKRKPKDAEFHAALARAYAESGGYNDSTIQEFAEAIALQPKSADYHAELGSYYLQHGQLAAAQDCINKALGLNPDNRMAKRAKQRLEQKKPSK